MPELPEVETVVKALHPALKGRVVEKVEFISKLRLPFDAAAATRRLRGAEITGVRRRAKYILADFGGDTALLAHLGMTGFFHIDKTRTPRHKHDRVAFRLRGGDELRFADARRFGVVQIADLPAPGGMPKELAGLGVEPLERGFSGRLMMERAESRKKCPVKVFVMDQAIVVGVGNIYASEALFAAGVDPRRPAASLSREEWDRVAAQVKKVLRNAIRQGGSTIRNYRTVDGSEGGFQRELLVYGRAGGSCAVCGKEIESARLGGRSTFYCPECQS